MVFSSFDRSRRDNAPMAVMSAEVWENGVSSNIKIEYPSFAIAAKMAQLEPQKSAPCLQN